MVPSFTATWQPFSTVQPSSVLPSNSENVCSSHASPALAANGQAMHREIASRDSRLQNMIGLSENVIFIAAELVAIVRVPASRRKQNQTCGPMPAGDTKFVKFGKVVEFNPVLLIDGR